MTRLQGSKRALARGNAPIGMGKRRKTAGKGTESQPVLIDNTQPTQPTLPLSSPPLEALGSDSQAVDFESQLRERLPEDEIAAPVEASEVATIATTEAAEEDDNTGFFLEEDEQDFSGIDWQRIPHLQKPLRTASRKLSWVYKHGWRLVSRLNTKQYWWVCHLCHTRRGIGRQTGVLDTSQATSSVSYHLSKTHRIGKKGLLRPPLTGGQRTIEVLANAGVRVSQRAANEMGSFNIQAFRVAAVSWLIDDNVALRQFISPMFRAMLQFANPEAERALWASHNSVSQFVMRLYDYMQPQVVAELRNAASKIHISFDGWTTKGGKRGFFGVVAHYAAADGHVKDVAIDLPYLEGSHTGDAIARCVEETPEKFGIDSSKLGYFVLDNAYNNDTAIAVLGSKYGFIASHRRLRCSAHTINLVGQAVMFGMDKDAFDNDVANLPVSLLLSRLKMQL